MGIRHDVKIELMLSTKGVEWGVETLGTTYCFDPCVFLVSCTKAIYVFLDFFEPKKPSHKEEKGLSRFILCRGSDGPVNPYESTPRLV